MNIKRIFTLGYDFYPCEVTASGIDNGSIELEFAWQLISIPIEFGYWDSGTHQHVHDGITIAKFKNYVLDQMTDLYGTGIVQVANTFTGDHQAFYSYVVGSTPESSPHNFSLCYNDGLNKEFSGFWIRIVGGAAPYNITWGE